MIRDVMRERKFSIIYHPQEVKEERSEGMKTQDDVNDAKLEWIDKDFDILDFCLFLRAKQMSSYLTIQGTTAFGTVL